MTDVDQVAARTSAQLRRLWSQDRPVFGLWTVLADPSVAALLATTAFDYVCIDLQHGIGTFSELPAMVASMRGEGRAPVVRVPWNEPASIMRSLDLGASAVLVPMVENAEQARRAASACRFPPVGVRSWGPLWPAVRAEGVLPPAAQDAAAICLVMVETRDGVDGLEDIVRVPGVDGVYIGPNDLALSCGHGRATYRDSPAVEAMIEAIISTCREAGVVAGLHCSDVDMALHWAGRGARMLTAGLDTSLLRSAATAAWAALDEAAGPPARRE